MWQNITGFFYTILSEKQFCFSQFFILCTMWPPLLLWPTPKLPLVNPFICVCFCHSLYHMVRVVASIVKSKERLRKRLAFCSKWDILIFIQYENKFKRNIRSTSHHTKSIYTSPFKRAFLTIHSNNFLKCIFFNKTKQLSFKSTFPVYATSAPITTSFQVTSPFIHFPRSNIVYNTLSFTSWTWSSFYKMRPISVLDILFKATETVIW